MCPRVLFRVLATCTAVLAGLVLIASVGEPVPSGGHAAHGMPMISVPAAAYTPLAPVLDRTGWTATASDFENVHEDASPGNVLDGDTTTIWHSEYWTRTVALPHWVTIDMHTVQPVSGVHYLPRQDGIANGNGTIGQFRVAVSTNGHHWAVVATGTWADDTTEKTAAFETTGARYVRLTGLTEAGDRGPWTSASEINLLGVPDTPPPATLLLRRTGWTATASDYEQRAQVDVPFNVLDNDPYTIWSSATTGTPEPMPHWISIDMKQPRRVSGLTYLPREGGGDGTIGGYLIELSADGRVWSDPVAEGTWADDTSLKAAYFAEQTARFVRLTATSEAGGRGSSATAAEINIVAPLNPAQAGRWGRVLNFPLVPVSAVVLPEDKLLTFSAAGPDAYTNAGAGETRTAILDLSTGTISQREVSDTGHEMFCTGLSVLSDGRVLVTGGSDSGATSIYNPRTDTWRKGPELNIPRGYQSSVTLSDGRVFTLGGSWSGGRGGKDAEVYTPDSDGGSWRLLPRVTADPILTADPAGPFRADNHGWFFAVGDRQVFHAGPSRAMHWFRTSGDGGVRNAGRRGDSADAMNGNAVMYDVGKIVTMGGATAYDGVNASRRAYTIDIGGGPGVRPVITRVSDMAFARSFASAVALPNGQVMVVGGQSRPAPFSDKGAALQPELWDPTTGRFTKLASMAVPRDYHSVATLLPDGRIFTGGGGLCGTCLTNHPDGQIFTPPYLIRADGSLRPRPVITSAPVRAQVGSTITVTAGPSVASFALMRMSSSTHAVDTDQRRVPITPMASAAGTFTLDLPASRGTLVPGNYLLFALTAAGVPSVATTINIR